MILLTLQSKIVSTGNRIWREWNMDSAFLPMEHVSPSLHRTKEMKEHFINIEQKGRMGVVR